MKSDLACGTRAWLALLLWAFAAASAAQPAKPIRFDDLNGSRAGISASKTYPLAGLGDESSRQMRQFTSQDGGEREDNDARRRSQNAAAEECNRAKSCYRTERIRSEYMDIRCLAGSKRGELESIRMSARQSAANLHDGALVACGLYR